MLAYTRVRDSMETDVFELVVCHELDGGVGCNTEERRRMALEEPQDAAFAVYVSNGTKCTAP